MTNSFIPTTTGPSIYDGMIPWGDSRIFQLFQDNLFSFSRLDEKKNKICVGNLNLAEIPLCPLMVQTMCGLPLSHLFIMTWSIVIHGPKYTINFFFFKLTECANHLSIMESEPLFWDTNTLVKSSNSVQTNGICNSLVYYG